MKKRTKKMAAAVLSLCLLLGMMPMTAGAALYEKTLDFNTASDVPVDTHRDQFWKYNDTNPACITISDSVLKFKRTKANFANEKNAYMRFTPQNALEGVVMVEFDIYFDKTMPAEMYSYDLFTINGKQLMKMANNKLMTINGNVVADLVANEPKHLEFTIDYNTHSYTLKCGENAKTETGIDGLSKFDYVAMIFAAGGLDSSELSDVTMCIDNFHVKQLEGKPATFVSAGIADKTGVGVTESAVITYDGTLDSESTLSGIQYEAADGTIVNANAVINGSTVVVSPTAALKAGTAYTLVVPEGAVKSNEASVQGLNISFATKRFMNDRLDTFFDFNNFEEGADASVVIPYIKNLDNYAYSDNRLSSSWANVKGTAIETAANATGVVTADDNLVIEHGKLVIKSKDATNWLRVKANQDITTGKVRVGYDLTFGSVDGASFIMQPYDNGIGLYIDKDTDNKTIKIGYYYDGAWKETLTKPAVADKPYHFDFVFDPAQKTCTLTFEGESYTGNLNRNGFQYFQLECPKSLGSMAIDNLSVEHIIDPVATISVANGATDVSTVDNLHVAFNNPMKKDDLKNITLTKGDTAVTAVTAVPDADGYGCTLKLTTALENSTQYTLSVPAMTDANGGQLAAQSVTFTTAATTPDFYITEPVVPVVKSGNTIKASATFNYRGESDNAKVWLGFALYDKDDKLLKLASGEYTFTAPGQQTVTTADMYVPDGVDHVKVFAWKNGLEAMSPICTVIQ